MKLVQQLGLVAVALAAAPVLAHHSYAMFDQRQPKLIEGSLAKLEYVNPHSTVWLYAKKVGGKPGEYELWAFEAANPGAMSKYGWKRDTLKPGEKIAIQYFPLRDGRKGGQLIRVLRADGSELIGDTVARGMSYRSLEHLPDLGGWWNWQFTPDDQIGDSLPSAYLRAPFKPEIAAVVQAASKQLEDTNTKASTPEGIVPDDKYDKAGYCKPREFSGVTGADAPAGFLPFEVLLTPGRVTLVDEGGLVRNVELNKSLPTDTDVDVSNAGTSVGHWEAQALVIETVRKAVAPGLGPVILHVTERFTLKEPDLLQNDVVLTFPAVYSKPYERTFLYRRDLQHEFHEWTACVDYDRFGDPVTGKQRFDLTPPPDLPPPPKE